MKARILPITASTYEPHALHRGDRDWIETNCYADLWIEVLHGFGLEPLASLAFTVALDFEGDQWLFFKQPTGDLTDLYGVEVQELNLWKGLLANAVEQVARGRVVMPEVDSFYLPDTQGTSYQLTHTKTTIGIQSIDTEAKTLGYFHNAGYFELSGGDFDALFGIGRERRADELLPYTEFAKIPSRSPLPEPELVSRSVRLLRGHLERRPRENPVSRFRARFQEDLVWLANQPPETFHLYAFSTLRQCGACFELAASYLEWLGQRGQVGLEPAERAFRELSGQSKAVQFKMARAVLAKRPVDFAPMLAAMEDAWTTAMRTLVEKLAPDTSG